MTTLRWRLKANRRISNLQTIRETVTELENLPLHTNLVKIIS